MIQNKPTPAAPPAQADPSKKQLPPSAVAVAPQEKQPLLLPIERLPLAPIQSETIAWQQPLEQTAEVFQKAPFFSAVHIGNTSVAFKVQLRAAQKNPLVAVFKPMSSLNGIARYKGEVAAYRLAQALHLPNVPPAWLRTIKSFQLEELTKTQPQASSLLQREVLPYVQDDVLYGAIIPWIDGYETFPLENPAWVRIWHGWLQGTIGIPTDQTVLAKELSNLRVFDYITGNFDRWSKGNVVHDKNTGMILFVDNDGSFWSADFNGAKEWKFLRTMNRFSKSLFQAMRSMTVEDFKSALGEKTPGVPLIQDNIVVSAYTRLQQVVQLIQQKSQQDPAVLFFE